MRMGPLTESLQPDPTGLKAESVCTESDILPACTIWESDRGFDFDKVVCWLSYTGKSIEVFTGPNTAVLLIYTQTETTMTYNHTIHIKEKYSSTLSPLFTAHVYTWHQRYIIRHLNELLVFNSTRFN